MGERKGGKKGRAIRLAYVVEFGIFVTITLL